LGQLSGGQACAAWSSQGHSFDRGSGKVTMGLGSFMKSHVLWSAVLHRRLAVVDAHAAPAQPGQRSFYNIMLVLCRRHWHAWLLPCIRYPQ
jgi:hypothetical protein